MLNKKVSIIIPTAGTRPDDLRQAVFSALNQSYNDVEVIIVSDGKNNSKKIMDVISDERVMFIEAERWGDPVRIREIGIEKSSGDFICFLDDDDILYQNHIETLIQYSDSKTIPFSRAKYIIKQSGKPDRETLDIEPDNLLAHYYEPEYIFEQNIAPISSFLIQRDMHYIIGGFDKNLIRLEDWDYWARMAFNFEFKFIDVVTNEIRVELDKISRTIRNDIFKNTNKLLSEQIKKRLTFMRENEKKMINNEIRKNVIIPKVSVIMPIYNAQKFLKEAIDSILNQTFKDFELLLINDGSIDKSKIIIEQYRHDPRIKIFHKKNEGITKTLNFGLAHSLGRYIARMDADDISMSERLELQVDFLDKNREVGLLGTRFKSITEDGKFIENLDVELTNKELQEMLLKSCRFGHPTVMIRRTALEMVGPYDESMWANTVEDYDLWLRIAEKFEIANLPQYLLYYRINSNSITQTKKEINRRGTQECILRAKARRGLINSTGFDLDYITAYKQPDLYSHDKSDNPEIESKIKFSFRRTLFIVAKKLLPASFMIWLSKLKSKFIAAGIFNTKKRMIYRFLKNIRKVALNVFKNYHLVVLFLLITPSIIWVFTDNSVWPWDTAWYGEISVDLYYKLTHSFFDWWQLMIHAFGTKAPGIAWIGQFFVPLAKITGSIDRALMVSVIVTQFLALLLMYKIVLSLTNKKILAILGGIIMASAPLFVGMGHQYFVESLQLLAVLSLIFIFVSMRKFNRYEIILSLIVLLPFAIIVKISSPLYLIFPVGLIMLYLFKMPEKISIRRYFRDGRNTGYYALAIVFSLIVIAWYVVNWDVIYQFMNLVSSGTAAELYGTRAPFFEKINLWLVFFQKSLFLPIVMYFVFSVVCVYLFQYIFLKKHKLLELPIIIPISSIVLVLVFLSFQINEETRYLLPLLPYVIIFICWILYKINNIWMNIATIMVFILQFIFINGYTLDLIEIKPQDINSWATVIYKNSDQKREIEAIVEQTCKSESAEKFSVVGVEYPFLNANSVEYYATQQKIKTNFQCYYVSLGFAENNVDKAWKNMMTYRKAPFFISGPSDLYDQEPDAFNIVALPIFEMVKNSELFVEEKNPALGQIKIFKNISINK
jgi:glycosyltransferase involved in cell wall biosynthesis